MLLFDHSEGWPTNGMSQVFRKCVNFTVHMALITREPMEYASVPPQSQGDLCMHGNGGQAKASDAIVH